MVIDILSPGKDHWMEPGSFWCCPVPGQGAVGTSWSSGGSVWTLGSTPVPCGWWSPGTGCHVESPSLRSSKSAGMWSWATCCRWPCLHRELDQAASAAPCQPQLFCFSVIFVVFHLVSAISLYLCCVFLKSLCTSSVTPILKRKVALLCETATVTHFRNASSTYSVVWLFLLALCC